ncbi:MAG: ribosomal protein L7/L12 [Deltaproteobacteria bacterium]|nr:ribosomal protein L7/L12 [Deltaproteobacteria bacterium]
MADRPPDMTVERAKVTLVGFDSDQDRYEAIKKLSEILGIGFEEAKDLADMAPVDIFPSIPVEAAENVAEQLGKLGAQVEVLALRKSSRFCAFHPHRNARARCKTCGEYICDIELLNSKGKFFCAEHFVEYKQRRVLRVVGVAFLSLWVVFMIFYFRDPILRTIKSVTPLKETKIAFVFVTDNANEQKSQEFMSHFQDATREVVPAGEQHSLMDLEPWFNNQYQHLTAETQTVVSMAAFGLYPIKVPPPPLPAAREFSYKAFEETGEYNSYFKEFMKLNNLDRLKSYDRIVMVDLVDRTTDPDDFMEHLGSAGRKFAYVQFPVGKQEWPSDYYVATVAHYVALTLGGTIKLTDKGFPMNPDGLANPKQTPRFPQAEAEITGCYRAVQEFTIERPVSLSEYVIGPVTAYELGWIPQSRMSDLLPEK